MRKNWAWFFRVLGWEGEDARKPGTFYREVVQAVLLFGLEMWVISPYAGFTTIWSNDWWGESRDGSRVGSGCTHLIEVAMIEPGMEKVYTYVARWNNTVSQFITTIPMMDLYLAAERRPRERVYQRWREQECLDLEGMWSESRAEEREGRKEGKEGYKQEWSEGLVYWLNTLGTYSSAPLASAPGSEPHHPNISILGKHGGWLDRER